METDAFKVTATETPSKSFAYRVDSRYGSVALSGQTGPSDNMVELAKEADLLIHDCTFAPDGMTTGGGPKQPCMAEYSGEFNCGGNPSIGFMDPIIKWDALNGGCEPDKTGSGVFCFYTNLSPSSGSQLPMALIKNGQEVCSGMLTGQCPEPPCVVPVEPTNWGKIKADHDK